MERSEILTAMSELKLYGMKAAYDEIIASAVKRQHEPVRIVGDHEAGRTRCQVVEVGRHAARRYPAMGRGPRLILGSSGTRNRHGYSSPRPFASPTRVVTTGAGGGATPSSTIRNVPRVRSVPSDAPVMAKASCSIPIECMLTYQLPACHATSFVWTIWATSPSELRTS